jgi:hypothetical protein
MATVYKRNSTYWVRFQWQGKEVRRSANTTSKATAQQFLGQILDEHRRLDLQIGTAMYAGQTMPIG